MNEVVRPSKTCDKSHSWAAGCWGCQLDAKQAEIKRLRALASAAARLFNALCFDSPDWVRRNEEVCGPLRTAINGEIRQRPAPETNLQP